MIKEKLQNIKSSPQANLENQGSDNMKQGWEIKKLGEVVDVLDNLRKPITKRDRVEGEYPYYGATGILSYVHNYIFSEKLVLIGEDGAKWASGDNTSFIAEGKYWVNNHAHVIRPNRKIILDEWIVYFLNFSDLTPFITGMTVPKLNQEKMRSIPIPLPPLPEQQRIVSILDKAFAAIDKAKANAEQNLNNAKELFESYLQGVFEKKGDGWEKKKLGEVFKIKPPKKEAKEKLSDKDLVSFLPMEDLGVCESEIKPKKEKPYIDVAGSYTYFAENDVLLAKITPCFENGKLGVAKNLINGIGFGSSEYIVFRCPENFIPEFLFYFLSRESFREEGKKYMSGAVGHKRVSMDWIENYLFSFPKSKTEQQTIVRQLDALRAETQKLEALYQKKIDNLEELKKSILQKAFSGELSGGEPIESITEKLEIV